MAGGLRRVAPLGRGHDPAIRTAIAEKRLDCFELLEFAFEELLRCYPGEFRPPRITGRPRDDPTRCAACDEANKRW